MIQIQHEHYRGVPPERPMVWCDGCHQHHLACRYCGEPLAHDAGRPESHTCRTDYGLLMMCACGGIVIKFEDGCKYDQNPWQRHNHDYVAKPAPVKVQTPTPVRPQAAQPVEKPKPVLKGIDV